MSLDQFLLSADTTDLNYPEVRPTLDLNFARVKALDPRITFTRSSGGSYVGADGLIKYAGVNEARFDHDPVTGESLGLLVEQSRTNLVTYSEEFDDAGWTKSGASITANNIVAPDGTLTAEKLVENTSNAQHVVYKSRTGSNETVTFSVFAKAGERIILAMQLSNFLTEAVQVNFNLLLGTKSTIISGGSDYTNSSASIIPYPNGWYRCILTTTKGSVNTNNIPTISTINTSSQLTYTGDGTSGVYIWGAQLEAGAFATSYIPTVASTRTRAADNASITGKNFSDFYNPSEFTMRCIFSRFSNNSPPYPLAISSSVISVTALPSIRIRTDGNRSVEGQAVSKENIVVINTNVNTFLNINQPCNAAIAVKSGDTIYSDSGKLASVSNLNGSFDTATTLRMGGNFGETNGHIRNVTYYPKRLPNAQLQALTR